MKIEDVKEFLSDKEKEYCNYKKLLSFDKIVKNRYKLEEIMLKQSFLKENGLFCPKEYFGKKLNKFEELNILHESTEDEYFSPKFLNKKNHLNTNKINSPSIKNLQIKKEVNYSPKYENSEEYAKFLENYKKFKKKTNSESNLNKTKEYVQKLQENSKYDFSKHKKMMTDMISPDKIITLMENEGNKTEKAYKKIKSLSNGENYRNNLNNQKIKKKLLQQNIQNAQNTPNKNNISNSKISKNSQNVQKCNKVKNFSYGDITKNFLKKKENLREIDLNILSSPSNSFLNSSKMISMKNLIHNYIENKPETNTNYNTLKKNYFNSNELSPSYSKINQEISKNLKEYWLKNSGSNSKENYNEKLQKNDNNSTLLSVLISPKFTKNNRTTSKENLHQNYLNKNLLTENTKNNKTKNIYEILIDNKYQKSLEHLKSLKKKFNFDSYTSNNIY